MKKGFIFLLVCSCIYGFISCSDTKSYTDHLNDERDEIDRLIDQKGFEILKNYPEDGVFKENQFFKASSGIYINVVDSGNGKRATMYATRINVRMRGEFFFNQDTASVFDYFPNGNLPMEFVFGNAYLTSMQSSSGQLAYVFLSQGMESALGYVGNKSTVKMIIPFKVGSYYQQSYYEPIYYDKITFNFIE